MNNPLTRAVTSNNLPLIQELLDNGANIHANNDLALIRAAMRGYTDIVQELVNRGANIHAQNDLALVYAAQFGRTATVRYLLDQGVNIHTRDGQALITASGNGKVATVRYLLDRGANIHTQNDRALIVATEYNPHLSVIEELLSRGADINVLSPELREQYQYLLPKIITVQEYYQIEVLSEKISEFPDRYMFYTKTGTYLFFQSRSHEF